MATEGGTVYTLPQYQPAEYRPAQIASALLIAAALHAREFYLCMPPEHP